MSMKDTLKKAKIAAMKAKDKAKLNPINLTLADIQNLEIANGHEATDEEVLKVIQKGVKTRRETAKLYEDKGLADKAAPETAEADFLETFLPAAASDEDYAKAVADAVAEVNPGRPQGHGSRRQSRSCRACRQNHRWRQAGRSGQGRAQQVIVYEQRLFPRTKSGSKQQTFDRFT